MTIGEIKIQALKLMFVTYTDDLTVEQLTVIGGQDNYRAYLINMDGAINRCFADIEHKRVLPVKTHVLNTNEWNTRGHFARFDLSTVPDFFDVQRVSAESLYDYDGNVAYDREGNMLILREFHQDAEYRLMYYPKIQRVVGIMDTVEADVPEEIAAFIPYYVKGDLFREDEPNEASEARNWYEAAMNAIRQPSANRVSHVKTVYSQV